MRKGILKGAGKGSLRSKRCGEFTQDYSKRF